MLFSNHRYTREIETSAEAGIVSGHPELLSATWGFAPVLAIKKNCPSTNHHTEPPLSQGFGRGGCFFPPPTGGFSNLLARRWSRLHAQHKNPLEHAWPPTIGIVRSRRDLTIPPLKSFLREDLAQPPLSFTTFRDPETLSDVEPADTSVPRNFVQIFWRRLGAEEFSLGP